MTPGAVRVVVVDDSPAFRGAAADVVDATPGFELVGAAESAEGAVATAQRVRPDLVLMDVRMPGVGGVEAARQIRAARNSTVVVLITAGAAASSNVASLETIDKWSLSPSTLQRLWDLHGGLTQQG
jgi:two-component system, NarL family, invasion response regulator UvrY